MAPDPNTESEIVLLLHGLFRSKKSMKKLARALRFHGYRTYLWEYPSTKHQIQSFGQELSRELVRLDHDPDLTRVHLVGHSLGCIVARHALSLGRPTKMGRVVMLAPPNQGSARARRYLQIVGWLSPAVAQLTDDDWSWVRQLEPPTGYEFGVIAGTHDGTTQLHETELPEQNDHVSISSSHTFIMKKPLAFQHTIAFLKTGHFLPRWKAEELVLATTLERKAAKKTAKRATAKKKSAKKLEKVRNRAARKAKRA